MDGLLESLNVFLGVVIALIAVGIGTERGTEIVKVGLVALNKALSSLFSGWFPKTAAWFKSVSAHPALKWALSGAVAYFAVNGFSLDFLNQFAWFQALDPELVNNLNIILLWVSANYLHPRLGLPGAATLFSSHN